MPHVVIDGVEYAPITKLKGVAAELLEVLAAEYWGWDDGKAARCGLGNAEGDLTSLWVYVMDAPLDMDDGDNRFDAVMARFLHRLGSKK